MAPRKALAPTQTNAKTQPKNTQATDALTVIKPYDENQVPIQKGKKRKSTDASGDAPSAPRTKKAKDDKQDNKPEKKPKKEQGLVDVSDIHLDGEEDGIVPVYATAADIRRQISTVFTGNAPTQKAFCEAISAAANTDVNTRQLQAFRSKGKKGAAAVHGADSPAFYAAWVYFEKVRIKQKGKKSAHRLEMESAWGEDGMDLEGLPRHKFIVMAGQSVGYNNLGQFLVVGP